MAKTSRIRRITVWYPYETAEYAHADENFHIAANTVLSLASRALDIFESSKANEKRQLLNFLIQNCRLLGKYLLFELKSPFNLILETPTPTLSSHCRTVLEL